MQNTITIMKGFKIRLFPNKEQEKKMWKHVDASRFIYNTMLELQNRGYEHGLKHLSRFDMIKKVKDIKEYNPWLKEVSSTTLQRVCADLDDAFQMFFEKINDYPKFKTKKKSKKAFPVRTDSRGGIYFTKNSVYVEKIGHIKYRSDIEFPLGFRNKDFHPYNGRIQFNGNKWILSFSLKCENQALDLTQYSMGIDLGIKELAVVSYNNTKLVYHNINKTKKVKQLERKLKHLQRNVSRKKNLNGGKKDKTNNIKKEKRKLAIVYKRLRNIRHNYIHKLTHSLVSLRPKTIIMEDLNISGLMKNHHLAKALQDACLYEIIRQTRYKSYNHGIEFVQVPMFYPSSKMCSCCGHIKKDLKLSDRIYVCSKCGNTIDRDENAAKNLEQYMDYYRIPI